MKLTFVPTWVLLAAVAALAQHNHEAPARQASLMPGLGELHHKISTANPEAQRFFDQGLRLIYGFNHEEARLAFERAAELDPQCAMAQWGIALAVGPNYNDPAPDLNRLKLAWEAVQKGLSLASSAPPEERAYLEALAQRYTNDPQPDLQKLGLAYKNAMGEVTKKYPGDLDAATLYAESAMNLRPWQLWTADGKPAEGTEEIVATLESVLKRDPNHIGANHYYIHAVEASNQPDRALPSAKRLDTLAPGAGHLVHMPAHIYMRTGDYRAATVSNEKAANVDREYIKKYNASGMYPVMYFNHNVHFLAVAASMEGRFAESIKSAAEVSSNVRPMVKDMPMAEFLLPTEMLILVRFRRWNDVMKLPEPDAAAATTRALWHFARGMALAATGKVAEAQNERQALADGATKIPPETLLNFNKSQDLLGVALHQLEGRIALARVSYPAAIEHFRKAAEIEDALIYDEPPAWYIPSREALGRALIAAGNYSESEKVFREELVRHPRSGRALFGLWQSLKDQGKKPAAKQAESEFRAAWKNADVKLSIADL
jgi:tetratricopeptide (TPR) repeat protein